VDRKVTDEKVSKATLEGSKNHSEGIGGLLGKTIIEHDFWAG
jgi:hypothetical protein